MPEPVLRRTPTEIREIAQGIIGGRYFVGSQAPMDMWDMIFLPIALGGLNGVDIGTVGMVIEDWSKAGERGINGFPMFLSCQLIQKDDWTAIIELVKKADAAMQAALDTGLEPVQPD